MRRAALCALLLGALALAFAGCGGSDSPRKRVESYIQDVTAVQARTNASVGQANQTYAAFVRGQLRGPSGRLRLARAERAIRDVRAQLGKLHPPNAARRLHARLLRYYDQSADLAYETTLLGRYEPAAQAALRSLPGLNRRLRARLGSAKSPGDQVHALTAYDNGLDQALRRLRVLHPPPILLPAHGEQIARLARTRRLAGELVAALKQQDTRTIATLLLRFRSAGNASNDPVKRLSAQAVRAYQQRLRSLTTDAAAVERERRRLEATLK